LPGRPVAPRSTDGQVRYRTGCEHIAAAIGAHIRGLSMDMARIHRLMSDLRLANECEAAAQMDVADAEHALDFAKRKVEAMKDRHKERQEACREISDELAEVVALETMAPLILMIEHERS